MLYGLASEGPDIHLSVSDRVRGIPIEQLDSIFKPFAQLDQSLARSDGGLGVGLTLAKSLVELHGGTIFAESAGLGHGSTFSCAMPRADIKTGCQLTASASEFNPPLATVTEEPYPTTLDICVIEDLADSRDLIKPSWKSMVIECVAQAMDVMPSSCSANDRSI